MDNAARQDLTDAPEADDLVAETRTDTIDELPVDAAHPAESGWNKASRFGLGGFMVVAGANHFANPGFYEPMVPSWVPGSASTWNVASGLAEIGAGALLFSRRTERLGGAAVFATLLAVYPANIQAALDGGMDHLDGPAASATAAWIRLPFQLPLLALAWRHLRRAPRG